MKGMTLHLGMEYGWETLQHVAPQRDERTGLQQHFETRLVYEEHSTTKKARKGSVKTFELDMCCAKKGGGLGVDVSVPGRSVAPPRPSPAPGPAATPPRLQSPDQCGKQSKSFIIPAPIGCFA